MSLNQQSKENSVSKIDIVINFMHAMESEHFNVARELTSNDFIFEDPSGSKFDINYFINVHSPLITACQPWTFGMSNFRDNKNSVFFVSQIRAKHTKDLIHSILGIKMRATNININLPKMSVTCKFSDEKIAYLKVSAPKDGGLSGLLHQIGYKKTQIEHPKD